VTNKGYSRAILREVVSMKKESKIKGIPFQQIDINNGFWHGRQCLNREETIYAVYDRFKDTGRFDAFKCDWKEGMPNKPHYFWDSDVAKWIESVAYLLEKGNMPDLEKIVDELVDEIEKNQDSNGYFNIWFLTIDPIHRFCDRDAHELYCAGHLIEAAFAYAQATGKHKFLHLMCKYVDYIELRFKRLRDTGFYTPGHEEIELSLIRLYRYTGEKRYLELSKHFLEERGRHNENKTVWSSPYNRQDHLPIREMTTAEGHAVRALYLYSAMADLAYETNDESLKTACQNIFKNILQKRMYITGGVGSTRHGEAFTLDYDLPSLTTYAETCAAIALIFFTQRMLLLDTNAVYADVAEKVLYNSFLSSTSLDGRKFFYQNPLEVVPRLSNREVSMKDSSAHLPPAQRSEIFNCSCCPPNITRFIASVGNLIYTCNENTLFVHHYMASRANINVGDANVSIIQETQYPVKENVKITVSGMTGKTLAIRLPSWCVNPRIQINDNTAAYECKKGYAMLSIKEEKITIDLSLPMPVTLIYANRHLRDEAGKVAVQRGPVIYCVEEADNGPELWSLSVNANEISKTVTGNSDFCGIPVLDVPGFRRSETKDDLYIPYEEIRFEPAMLHMIPYFAFANRGECEMRIWLNTY
jgi:DUF1680 family protein